MLGRGTGGAGRAFAPAAAALAAAREGGRRTVRPLPIGRGVEGAWGSRGAQGSGGGEPPASWERWLR